MQEGKLIKLLKALNREEFRNLEDYLNSPFFLKKSKDALLLYKALKRQHPDFKSVVLTKKRVFKKVYHDQDYSDGKMRNLLSKLVKVTESYLLHLDTEKDEFEKEKRLMLVYKKRKITNEFIKSIRSLKNKLKNNPLKDVNYFFQLYSLDKHLYFNENTPEAHKTIEVLKNSLQNFHHYFVLERIYFGMDLKNREAIYKEKHNFKIDDFSNIIPKNNLIYKIYKTLFQLLEDKSSISFLELNKLYHKHINKISHKDKAIIFIIIQNFLGYQLAQNEELFIPIAFQHFKIGLEEKFLINNGKLNPTLYLNISITASRLKKYKWTHSFIEKYTVYLPIKIKELAKNLATGYLEFNKKNYLGTLDILSKINKEKNVYTQKINNLSIRTYFKLFQQRESYLDILLSKCNSFERALQRDKIKAKRKIQPNIEFIKLVRKITIHISKDNWSERIEEKLLIQVNSRPITLKRWLINEIKLLKKS